jgi:hypothetical protein
MAKKLDPMVAEAVMLGAGLKPLESYKGSGRPWKCRCQKCKKIVEPSLSNIRQGHTGCAYCAGQKIDEKDAIKVMLKAGLRPIEPYLNSTKPWKCVCKKCGKESSPTYGNVSMGSICYHCANVASHKLALKSSTTVIPEMLKAQLEPLEPYRGANRKWKCKCLKCGVVVYPKYASVYSGQGGCDECGYLVSAEKRKISEEEAVSVMLRSGLKPLEPYKSALSKWKCEHIKCGNIVYPKYNQIYNGQGGCITCAPFGINMENPSYLYLITNPGLNAHKVGIGNHKKNNDRLGRFIKTGWEAHKVWQTKTGAEALEIEKVVFKILRKDMKLPIYLSKEDMPKTEGHSETVDADAISLLQLEKIINKVIKGLQR